MNDPYKGFAERYDLFHGEFTEHDPEVIEFFRDLFEAHNVESVLDCACGTGKDIHLFYTLGCEVCGSDKSEAMIAQANKNLNNAGISIPLQRADYRNLFQHFDRKFDAIVCLSSSILHMPNEQEVQKAFKSIREMLNSNGILVMTQGTTDRQWREKPRFILASNTKEYTRLFVIDYVQQGAIYNILDIFHIQPKQELKEWSIEYPYMMLRNDHEELLEATGFSKIDFYGTFGFEEYDLEKSNRLIVVAQK